MKHLAPYFMKTVRFDHSLRRIRDGRDKSWRRVPCLHSEGVVVGIRRLQDGVVSYWGDDGATFEPKSSVLALMVVFSPWRNPVYVLPSDTVELAVNRY